MIEKELTKTPADRRISIDNGVPDSELVPGNFMRVRQCDDINQKPKKQAIFDNIKPESIFDLEFVQTWSKKKGFIRFMFSFTEKAYIEEYAELIVELKNTAEPSGKSYHTIALMGPLEEVETLNLPQFNFFDYFPKDKE